jgi:8-oxo-dGTP pyrophosphatase MutT (NUDIX family)
MRGTTNIPEVSVIIRKNNKILFVLRQNTGWSDGMYCMPSGHVEDGEKFTTAAVREALEEVGVTIEDMHPVHVTQRISTGNDVRFGLFFEATKWSGIPKNMEPERHGKIAWFAADNLPYADIVQFQVDALKAIHEGNIYSELGW